MAMAAPVPQQAWRDGGSSRASSARGYGEAPQVAGTPRSGTADGVYRSGTPRGSAAQAAQALRLPGSAPGSARGVAGEAPPAVHLSQALESHREHRVTVPMPKSLDELRGVAQRRFKNGRGLYHHGRQHLSHNNHLAEVVHDDVVVVGLGGDEPTEAFPTTTHKSHFVPHDAEPRASCAPDPNRGDSGPWYGASRYSSDFVPHSGVKPRVPVRPPDGLKVGRGTTGKSSYRAQYPWQDTGAPERITNYELHCGGRPFDGASSYQTDFKPSEPNPRSLMKPKERPLMAGEFFGTSTYGAHYEDPEVGCRQPVPPRPPALTLGDAPFDSNSEYTSRYIKHPHERAAMLHLEPQKRLQTVR